MGPLSTDLVAINCALTIQQQIVKLLFISKDLFISAFQKPLLNVIAINSNNANKTK